MSAPAPLVPAEADLRGYEFMPLYAGRLRDSDFNARATDAEFRAAMNLWWSAWCQLPPGSLPNDDMTLCKLADLGRDQQAWQAVKARALHGFIECSDGRLYHPFLAQLVIEAWDIRSKARAKGQKGAAARWISHHKGPKTGDLQLGYPQADSGPVDKIMADAQPQPSEAMPQPPPADATATKNDGKGQDRKGHKGSSTRARTRKPVDNSVHDPEAAAAADPLIYPEKLNPAAIEALRPVLAKRVDAQLLLDELAGIMGTKKVDNPGGLMQRLIDQADEGTLIPSHADRIQIEREGRAVKAERAAAQATPATILTFRSEHAPAGDWWKSMPGILERGRTEGMAAVKGESINAFRARLIAKIGDGPWTEDLTTDEKTLITQLREGKAA